MPEVVTPSDVCLYVAPDLRHGGFVTVPGLRHTTERHPVSISAPSMRPVADLATELSPSKAEGMVVALESGLPSPEQLRALAAALTLGRRAWIYWPAEEAIECIDDERIKSLERHVARVKWMQRICVPYDNAVMRWRRVPGALRWIYRGEFPVRRADILVKLTQLTMRAQPLPLPAIRGTGMYLRADYWADAPDVERTARVVRAIAAASGRAICLTPRDEPHLECAGVQHVLMERPRMTTGEDAIVMAPTHYLPIVKAACQAVRPAYLYDRLTAGESAGAEVSQLLSIPYVVEYRGAGAPVREALNGAAPFYHELYAQTEELALRQATAVVVESPALKQELIARGIDASRVIVVASDELAPALTAFVESRSGRAPAASIETGDAYKNEVQNQWNTNPVGSQYARESQPHTLDWFREVERHRYDVYAPWMREVMEFSQHAGEDVLEIGGGVGTDLAQFAASGARVTDVDLAAGHLQLAEENFKLRGLAGTFIHHDAESLPFPDASFDVVYSNGVLHHTPNTAAVVREIRRVLRPGGRAIVMLYAEDSLYYWRKLVWFYGIKERLLDRVSMGEIMSRLVERSANDARPLVKVYTKPRAARLFKDFEEVEILQRQLEPHELPDGLKWTRSLAEQRFGWNLIIKASKPR